MKKILSIVMMLVVLITAGTAIDAQGATKKKARSTAAANIKFEMLDDGYPDVGGHTYSATVQGYKMTVTFGPMGYGAMGEVDIKVSQGAYWEEEINNWYYKGDGVIMFYMDGGTPCYFDIENDGKLLVSESGIIKLKAIK